MANSDQQIRPERRRSNVRRISAVIAVVISIALAVVAYRESRILPERIAGYVNRHYLAGTPFEFSLDGVSGTFVRRINLQNPVLRYHSPEASYNVFRADRISVTYELIPVFAFRLLVDDVELENVVVHLRQDQEGRLIIPGTGVPKPGAKKKAVSPVVDVRHFRIDGLALTFGGNETQLAIRDVNLDGAFAYDRGVGHLSIEEGRAYLLDTGTTVEAVRLNARSDWRSIFVDDFAVKLDSSFVVAKGEFREGRFQDVELVLNPISLEELHQLGLIPDEHGTFDARLSLSGTVDSLGVRGRVSGEGLGVALENVDVEGHVTPRALDLDRLAGKVFGSSVDGAFRIEIESEDFVFDGRVADLDLGRGFIEDSDLPPMSLNGAVRVEHTKAVGRYVWRGELERGVIDGYETFDVSAAGVWVDGVGLTLDRFSTVRPSYRIEGSGTVADQGPANVVFKAEGTDFSYFWNYFELPPVSGAMALTGHLEGPLDDFQVNVNGTVRDLAWEFTEVDSGTVQAEVRRAGTLAPEVTLSLSGRRARVYGHPVVNPSLLMDVDTTSVRIHDVRVTRSDSTFVADFDVVARGKESRVFLKHAALETPNESWNTTGPSVIDVSEDAVVVDSLVLASSRGEFGYSGTRRVREKRIDGHVWGRNVNLAIFRDVLRVPIAIEGVGTFDLHLEGSEENPRARLSAAITRGLVDSVAFDAARATLSFDGERYRLSELWVQEGDDTLTAQGEWACDLAPRVLAREDRPASLWRAPISVRARVGQYDLSSLFRAMHRPTDVASTYTGTVTVGGTLGDPELHTRGEFMPLPGPGHPIPPTQVDAAYRNGALRIARLDISQVVNARATATIPMTVSFRDGARIQTDRPMEARIEIDPLANDALSNFTPYVRDVSNLRGVLSGRVDASGTPSSPRLTGALSFSRGELRVAGVQEGASGIAMRVDFVDDVIRLTSLTASSGKKGSLVGAGWARVSNYRLVDYQVDVTAHEFPLRSIPDVEVVLGGTLTARLSEWSGGGRIPTLTGRLNVKEAVISKDLSSGTNTGSELTRPTARPDWLASIDVVAPKNVWVRNEDLNVELGAEDLVFLRDERGMYFRGELTVLRGSYKLYGNKFTITQGTMDFSASETLRPSMNIEAYTPHRGGDEVDNRIYLVLSWPYDKLEPHISLSYDEPGYSESDIWRMLGGNIVSGGVATNTLERAINAQMAGGFTVDVDQRPIEEVGAADQSQETLIGVGKYLWEDIYLQYRRGLSVGGEQEFNVEYRLSNKFLLRSQFIYNSRRNRTGIVGQNTDEFNLDLKYRFEY
ncbi:MAG TPA: translocation/assembly module TamB domain-containing protein [Candidatus Krumholzibacteria bacterium]|nr:translocation/assembly module TamB domain-containing protein [Candidatus Krumholzibacteria bacterium]